MSSSTSRNSEKLMLRLPDGLRAQLSDAAKANRRSMNAEAVIHLAAGLAQQNPGVRLAVSSPEHRSGSIATLRERIERAMVTLATIMEDDVRLAQAASSMEGVAVDRLRCDSRTAIHK